MPTCPTCHGQYAESELLDPERKTIPDVDALRPLPDQVLLCPRCETDIYSWRSEAESIVPIIKRPFPLILPLLAIVLWRAGKDPHWVGTLLAVILSAVAFLVLQNKAPAFRIAQWARPFQSHPGPSLVVIELGSFLVGLVLGLVTVVLMKLWILPPAEPEFVEKIITSLVYSLFFVLITVALTALMLNNQVRQLDRFMPQPIVTNTARLLRIVMTSARRQLNLAKDPTIENIERTDDAGIEVVVSLKQRAQATETTSEITISRKREGRALKTTKTEEEKVTRKDEKGGVARWAIKGDMWGRIRSIDVRDWWSFVE